MVYKYDVILIKKFNLLFMIYVPRENLIMREKSLFQFDGISYESFDKLSNSLENIYRQALDAKSK